MAGARGSIGPRGERQSCRRLMRTGLVEQDARAEANAGVRGSDRVRGGAVELPRVHAHGPGRARSARAEGLAGARGSDSNRQGGGDAAGPCARPWSSKAARAEALAGGR